MLEIQFTDDVDDPSKAKAGKPILFIDVDDTIIARMEESGPFELRPVVGLLRHHLVVDFDCRWLTCVGPDHVERLFDAIYGGWLMGETKYEHWDLVNKARTALKYDDFWWLEDGLGKEETALLLAAGKLDRFIYVNDVGLWGFHEAVKSLYLRVGTERLHLTPEEYLSRFSALEVRG